MMRAKLGDWQLPSGNAVSAYLSGSGKYRDLVLEWDSPPPLRAQDEAFYRIVIRPAVVRLSREYLELSGSTAIVELR